MSHIFGAFTIDGTAIPDSIGHALDAELAGFASARRTSVSLGSVRIESVDFGHLGSPGVVRSNGSITLVAGDPLHLNRAPRDRFASAKALNAALERGDSDALLDCCGSFCGVHLHSGPETHLSIFTDSLAVRPMYLYRRNNLLVCSTRLGLFHRFRRNLLTSNEGGLLEILAFGFGLGENTPFCEVRALPAAAIIRISGAGVSERTYRAWDVVPVRNVSQRDFVREIDSVFTQAIRDRVNQRDIRTAAFLSGGMDSRAIVGKLVTEGLQVTTVNYAPSGSLDRELGGIAAAAVGSSHIGFEPIHGDSVSARRNAAADAALRSAGALGEESGRTMWAGDGGSVCLGHVYLDQSIIELARSGGDSAAANAFVKKNSVGYPSTTLKRRYHRSMETTPVQAIEAQLRTFRHPDPARRLFLFLLMNDQRRHMYGYYERLGPDGYEQLMPFFDPRLITLVLSAPLDHLIEHRAYHAWFTDQSIWDISREPWQTYPGHIECPLPFPDHLRYQWAAGGIFSVAEKQVLVRESARAALRALRQPNFPRYMFRLPVIAAALALCWAGKDALGYVPAAINRISAP